MCGARSLPQAALEADGDEKLGRCRRPAYDAGIGDGWAKVGPCHKQRYLRWVGRRAGWYLAHCSYSYLGFRV